MLRRDVRELADPVDRARVRRARDPGDGERRQAGRRVAGDGRRDRGAPKPEQLVGRDDDEGLGREAEQVKGPRDREVGLVAGVDPRALEVLAARRTAEAQQSSEMQVARDRHAHEVGHDPARGQETERAGPVPDEVAQPADDLLLDERGHRAGVPDVDALVRHLGEQLAHHRDRQRRRREVAELARVLGVHLAAREARPELRRGSRRPGSG